MDLAKISARNWFIIIKKSETLKKSIEIFYLTDTT